MKTRPRHLLVLAASAWLGAAAAFAQDSGQKTADIGGFKAGAFVPGPDCSQSSVEGLACEPDDSSEYACRPGTGDLWVFVAKKEQTRLLLKDGKVVIAKCGGTQDANGACSEWAGHLECRDFHVISWEKGQADPKTVCLDQGGWHEFESRQVLSALRDKTGTKLKVCRGGGAPSKDKKCPGGVDAYSCSSLLRVKRTKPPSGG